MINLTRIKTLLAVFVSVSAMASEPYLVFYGTYTGGNSPSKGIYRSTFDAETGKLSQPELAAEVGSPSFLAITPSKQFLYAVGQADKGVAAFKLSLPEGKLEALNSVSPEGKGPCHVSTDHTGRMLAIANYGSGSTTSYQITATGALSEAVSKLQHEGSSVNPKRQAGPHAHSVNFSPDNRYAYVCDLGLDKILIYKADPKTGALVPADPAFCTTPPGGGPRHLAFHPSGKYVFSNNEMGMSVSAYAWTADNGSLKLLETYSTLPAGEGPAEGLSTAETVCHPNGRFVYVSNRGHDTIAVFSCDPATGKLELRQNASAEGEVPRNFNLDPSGRWMIVGHQKSNSIALLKVDAETGMLSPAKIKYDLGAPVCIRFVPLAGQ